MAGIKISNAEQVTSKDSVGQHKIPCATGDGSAKCITVDALFDYIEQNLGLTSIPVFSEEKSYKAPDLVKYNGLLYQFITTKEAGPWDVTKAQQTSVFAQLTTLRMGDDEQVQVTISSADSQLNVEGLDVLCEYDDIKETKQTDAHGVASFVIPRGKVYKLSISQQAGYYPVSAQTYKALVDNRYVEFRFSKELSGVEHVSVTPLVSTADGSGVYTPFIGKEIKVYVEGEDVKSVIVGENGWALFDVEIGKEYRVEFPHVDSYTTPADLTFTAELAHRVIIPQWALYIGEDDVLIACDDGVEYTFDAYLALEAKPEMLAIHICPSILTKADSGIEGVSGCDFYLPFAYEMMSKQFCSQEINFASLPIALSATSGGNDDAHFCYKGLHNTQKILAEAQTKNVTVAACSYCTSKTLAIKTKGMNGEVVSKMLQGFLGEYGQLFAILTALKTINAIMASKNIPPIDLDSGAAYWWSCTKRAPTAFWLMKQGSPVNYIGVTNKYIALPLYA